MPPATPGAKPELPLVTGEPAGGDEVAEPKVRVAGGPAEAAAVAAAAFSAASAWLD